MKEGLGAILSQYPLEHSDVDSEEFEMWKTFSDIIVYWSEVGRYIGQLEVE